MTVLQPTFSVSRVSHSMFLMAVLILSAYRPGTAATGGVIYVLFTVDVETRAATGRDADIWGIVPAESERHGIERMMDLLDCHGAKGTFFVNVYDAPTHAEDVMAAVCRTIHKRGHGVELHTHPAPMFGLSYMQYADLSTQTEILRRGASLLRYWLGVEALRRPMRC